MTDRTVGPGTLATDEASWWEEERLKFIVPRIIAAAGNGPVLDVGCGRGTAAMVLSASTDFFVVAADGFQYPEWKLGERVSFVVCDGDHLPFRDGTFATASAFDVIEHADDDAGIVNEMARVTVAGGTSVFTVPAFQRLWSAHDVAVGHRRRYSRASFAAMAARNGHDLTDWTYFFTYLAVPAWLLRRRRRMAVGESGKLTRRAARLLSNTERRWLRRRRSPLGTSLFVALRRSGPG